MKIIYVLVFLLVACDQADNVNYVKSVSMNGLTKSNLSFVCKYQFIPEQNSEGDFVFNYARWLQKNNQLKQDGGIDKKIERLYRIAAESGSVKANINLQNGAVIGRFNLSDEERLRMSQQLIDTGIGAGYYFIALYLRAGSAGLKKDLEMSLRFMRKAADEGNPQAQAFLGNELAPIDIAPEVSRNLRHCAAEQGQGEAATDLAIDYKINEEYQKALESFQLGVAAGDFTSASFLLNGFDGPEKSNALHYLGLQKDPERVKRYQIIWDVLEGYSYANPKIPEINEIVPLPPAPLPAWDGKLKWLEERIANIPPEKPSEALINRMAKDKQLDPATGKPLPTSPHFVRDDAIKLLCRNGEACPVSGYWEMEWWDYNSLNTQRIVLFNQGDILPADRVRRVVTRPWPFEDKIMIEEKMMAWRLVAEA